MKKILCIVITVAAAGCTEHDDTPQPVASAAPLTSAPAASASAGIPSPRAPLSRPRTQSELGTTNARIFMGNLQGSVTAAKERWLKDKPAAHAALLYATPLTATAKISGDLNQFGKALEVVETALTKEPKNPKLLAQQAGLLSSLHRFDKAAAAAKAAHELAPSHATRVLLAEVAWNSGNYDVAIKEIRAIARDKPSLYSLARLAQLEFALGHVKGAEDAFARAETQFKNVSPVPIAWLNVQRGLLGLHTGRFEMAQMFYREAVDRMPDYPMAVEHLAEIEALRGQREEAVTRYKKVVKATDNPELIGALGGLLAEYGQTEESERMVKRAKDRFDELLKRFPEAMAGHAADFYLGEGGDKKRALALLERNFQLRPNAEASAALAAAKLENGDLLGAAKLVDEALASPVKKAEIYWTAARIRLAQERAADSKALAAKAKALNPKIAVLEGPLAAEPEPK